ncbi:MAG: DNA-binding protein Alba [Candidatus Bathyarchaeia archaeon]
MSESAPSKPAVRNNIVLVGKKPLMNYVVACVTSFNQGGDKVVLKARGSAIATAVDVVQVLKRAFVKDLIVGNIVIGTEELERDGRKSSVSTMEISIQKPVNVPRS